MKSLDNEVKFQTKGCEEFEISPDTLNLKNLDNIKINLKPVKFRVSGRVASKETIPDLKVLAKSETRMVELELEKVDNVGYSFHLMAFAGEEVVFQVLSKFQSVFKTTINFMDFFFFSPNLPDIYLILTVFMFLLIVVAI